MKNWWTLVLICCAIEASGQQSFEKKKNSDDKGHHNTYEFHETNEQGAHNLSAGYGIVPLNRITLNIDYPHVDNFKGVTGPFYLKYEYGVKKKMSIGVSGAYINEVFNFQDKSQTQVHVKLETYSILLRFNWYSALENNVVAYAGFGIGYLHYNWEEFHESYGGNYYKNSSTGHPYNGRTDPAPIGFEATGGIKVYFTSNLGAFFEIGIAKSLFKAGLVYKLGGN